ncbi:MAG TPA: TetR/AcrR family transcriptional regulator [Solirubrobacteraceae bacterium]
MTDQPPDLSLRNAPLQARSRARLGRVLDAAEEVLERDGADGFSTTAVARMAGVSVGSVYRFFPDKQAIVEALAVRYWSDFADLVAGVAEADAHEPVADPASAVLGVLAAGFRARPGFLALWYGGLRTERVRDRTRDCRRAIATSIEHILAVHWPATPQDIRALTAQMVVLAGDGLLREAFRRDLDGDAALLAESSVVLSAYIAHRLAAAAPSPSDVR